ncbi:unnamed protein product, partial [Mesorhabditis spiculigera]
MGKAYRPKSATQRQGANAREKFRNIDINSAYETLISKIQPALNATQLNELPKVKRLQLAIHYIKYLEGVLGQEHEYKENPQNLLQQFQDQALEVIRYPSAQSVNCGYPAGMLPSFSFTSEDWNQISPVYPEYQSPNGYSSQ